MKEHPSNANQGYNQQGCFAIECNLSPQNIEPYEFKQSPSPFHEAL